jgi:adsorption protein B
VHPLELALFDRLIDRAGLIQLPVLPLPDPSSPWIAGHYCDEFAEAHIKELVVREAVGAAIPLAGVACAIAREPLASLAALHDGQPFAGGSLTEDYELGLIAGELGLKTMFVRIPAYPGDRAVVASRGHFPSSLGSAVRQKARWLGGIALTGWDRLGWRGGMGERWMRMRDRRGPLAALLLVAAYLAAFLWSQIWVAEMLGAPIRVHLSPALSTLLTVNAGLLAWRIAMRAGFTTSAYGWRQGLMSVPRLIVGNVIAMLAAGRALTIYARNRPPKWDKTRHVFPAEAQR